MKDWLHPVHNEQDLWLTLKLARHFLKCGNLRKIHQPSSKSAPVTQVWEMLYNYNHALGNHWADQLLKTRWSPGVDENRKKILNCLPNVFDHWIPFSSKYLLLDSNTSCTTNRALNIMQRKSLLESFGYKCVHSLPQGSHGLPGFTTPVAAKKFIRLAYTHTICSFSIKMKTQ